MMCMRGSTKFNSVHKSFERCPFLPWSPSQLFEVIEKPIIVFDQVENESQITALLCRPIVTNRIVKVHFQLLVDDLCVCSLYIHLSEARDNEISSFRYALPLEDALDGVPSSSVCEHLDKRIFAVPEALLQIPLAGSKALLPFACNLDRSLRRLDRLTSAGFNRAFQAGFGLRQLKRLQ